MIQSSNYNLQPPRPPWGIRAPAHKVVAMGHPIRVAALPPHVALPIAADVAPLVRPGDRVLTGQPVGRGPAGVVVPASITGHVTAVAMHPVAATAGHEQLCVVIARDGEEIYPGYAGVADPLSLDPRQLRERINDAGIVGLGGAMYPTAAKLGPGRRVGLLIVNGAECEPWISCDEMLLRERPEDVVDGARIMMHALGADEALIAVETNMPEARVALHHAVSKAGDQRLRVAVVTAKYPAGGERQLIELLTGREVPSGGLPADVGCVCQNVATAAAVADLMRHARPLISRIVTVSGGGIARPGNFEVRIGSPIRAVVAEAGGYQGMPVRLILGGPMMGIAVTEDSLAITAATNCIVAATASELAIARPEMPCIRCGACIQVCPARLLPQELLGAARRSDVAALLDLGLQDCIECGCCDYVCPSSIPLTASFVSAKRAVPAGSGPRAAADS